MFPLQLKYSRKIKMITICMYIKITTSIIDDDNDVVILAMSFQ